MKHIPVDSSNIASVGYEANTLEITFNSGGTYQYKNVPESVFRELLDAPSKGKFFHQHIKNIYSFVKL
ncbi:MAG: KTSC domain-containing protein [Deinococcota bacterium]